MAPRSHLKKVRSVIRARGWAIQPVLDNPAYSYTIGLNETFEHPEVVLVGLDPEKAASLIEVVVGLVTSGVRMPVEGRHEGVIQNFDVFFRMFTGSVVEHLTVLHQIYPHANHNVLQLVIPAPAGLFPWEPGCQPEYISFQRLGTPFTSPVLH